MRIFGVLVSFFTLLAVGLSPSQERPRIEVQLVALALVGIDDSPLFSFLAIGLADGLGRWS